MSTMLRRIVIMCGCLIFVFGIGASAHAATWSENNVFDGTINWFKKGIKIGEQGSGGVTFFNGTIVNETTTGSAGNPITIGDDLRVDGAIWRGSSSGPGDDQPVKINDDLLLYGAVYGLGIADVEDLQAALDAKSATSHNHDTRYVRKSSPTWSAQTGFISVHPASCIPENYTSMYLLTTLIIRPHNDNSGAMWFYCPLQLPHGATLVSWTMYAFDNSASNIEATLNRQGLSPASSDEIASLDTLDFSSDGSVTTTTFSETTVDNESNNYNLALWFDNSDPAIYFRGAVIEYTVTAPY